MAVSRLINIFCMKQAGWGIPPLYGMGALCMGLMVIMVWGYVRKFGVDASLMKAGNKKKVRNSYTSRWAIGLQHLILQ